MKISDLKTCTEVFIPWLTLIAAIVGASWTLYQFSQQRYESRVKETLDYIKQYDDRAMREARNRVYILWKKEDDDFSRLLSNKSIPENDIADFVVQAILRDGISASILDILDFFERLSICTEANLYDRAIAVLYMRRHLQEFWRQNYYFIEYARREYQNNRIGRGTESLYTATLE
jgi:hypothetical protein